MDKKPVFLGLALKTGTGTSPVPVLFFYQESYPEKTKIKISFILLFVAYILF